MDSSRLQPAKGVALPEGTKVVALHPNYSPMWDAKLGARRDNNTVRAGYKGVTDRVLLDGAAVYLRNVQ